MDIPTAIPERRASAVAIPAATPQQIRELAEAENYRREREGVEGRRQLRGLLVLALIVVVVSVARAGVGRVFPHDWWRVW